MILCQKEKLLIMSNFSLCHTCIKVPLPQMRVSVIYSSRSSTLQLAQNDCKQLVAIMFVVWYSASDQLELGDGWCLSFVRLRFSKHEWSTNSDLFKATFTPTTVLSIYRVDRKSLLRHGYIHLPMHCNIPFIISTRESWCKASMSPKKTALIYYLTHMHSWLSLF